MLLINKYKEEAVDDKGTPITGKNGGKLLDFFILDEEPIFSSILHNMVLG